MDELRPIFIYTIFFRWDDTFVTGLLREKLDLSILCLTPGARGILWDYVLSHCLVFSFVKQFLFNDIVLQKGPVNMSYVNNYKFLFCNVLEFQLERLESVFPSMSQVFAPFWSFCARKWLLQKLNKLDSKYNLELRWCFHVQNRPRVLKAPMCFEWNVVI